MKFLSKIFFALFLLSMVAVGFPSAVKAACSCSCSPTVTTVGDTTSQTCDAAKLFVLGDQADQNACAQACAAVPNPVPSGSGMPTSGLKPCYQAAGTCKNGNTVACWCNAGAGPLKKTDTSSETDCKKACSDAKNDFVAWSNTPPSPPGQSGVVKCPPGGIWTPDQCAAATNSEGVKIGEWKAPAGQKEGPYCFYNNAPIKLGVGLGALTQANLSQYLAAAYNLALGFAAVLAVIFIMIGGFRYIAAAGGAEVDQGKSMIKNAVIGLVLAALSYTLLQTVNPDILSLRLPTIQLIKPCDVGSIDCGSTKNKTDCEKNADPSKKCIWNPTLSTCEDNSAFQSGTQGQLGGSCVNKDGNMTCDVGWCVHTVSNIYLCSSGGTCQACINDSAFDPQDQKGGQCQAPGGIPVMCINNMCAKPNPNNPPTAGKSPSKDNYILCTGTSGCSSDAQCATRKCLSGKCIISNQGSDCLAAGEDACTNGSKCLSFERPKGLLKVCCADGNKENCLGCNQTDNQIDSSKTEVNSGCPTGMICSLEGRCATAQ